MAGEDSAIVKMCNSCMRLLPADTIACPDCGGILFSTVNLGVLDDEEE